MRTTTVRIALIAATASLASVSAWAQSTLYFQSQPGDFIGQGQTATYTDIDGSFGANGGGTRRIDVAFTSVGFSWFLNFEAPEGQVLGAGMYEGATRWPFQSPTRPGLDVSGDGRGCNTSNGRFLVLEATYDVSGEVMSFAADFEQHCEGVTPALYGAIRFNSALPFVPRLSVGGAAAVEGPSGAGTVSYTHLTLPTKRIV